MTKEITSKIKAVRIRKEPIFTHTAPAIADIDPLTARIEGRPEGALEAISEKIKYHTQEGKRKVYVIVAFINVTGVIDGKPVSIERPVEFFYPSGQLSNEHQWITATMRSISLAARGGYITQALQDLRKVAWDKGVIRCGLNEWGKPLYHESEVAAIAWSIQQILYRRGFLDINGNQRPTAELIQSQQPQPVIQAVPAQPAAEVAVTPAKGGGHGACPQCESELVLMDGCPTCVGGCGWSKCG